MYLSICNLYNKYKVELNIGLSYLFPPISKVTGVKCRAAACITSLPTRLLPV